MHWLHELLIINKKKNPKLRQRGAECTACASLNSCSNSDIVVKGWARLETSRMLPTSQKNTIQSRTERRKEIRSALLRQPPLLRRAKSGLPVWRPRDRSWRSTNQRKGQVSSCWFRRRNKTGSSNTQRRYKACQWNSPVRTLLRN